MHIHILGICGTFMSGLAIIAKQQGHHVTGSDENVYPPMSAQLEQQGIILMKGYDPSHLEPAPDCVVIGNAMSRGNPAVEYVLEKNLPYMSGPQWLAEHVLINRWVLAVSGTHGKTTTASQLAWILEYTGTKAGFLIGGIPENFGVSARYTKVPFFVIEADEYDTAFFDKRSKFMHFHPRTLIINGLEFDHADIFSNLEEIKKQFHYLLRTVPGNGLVIAPDYDENVQDVIQGGCWTSVDFFGFDQSRWEANLLAEDGSHFEVLYDKNPVGEVHWTLLGEHNVYNALAAVAAAHHTGIPAQSAVQALNYFKGVKRRLELKGQIQGISVYDDFAHHPTAIATTLAGLRAKVGEARIIVIMEFASYTMRVGVHRDRLVSVFSDANYVLFLRPELNWNIEELAADLPMPVRIYQTVPEIIEDVTRHVNTGDHIVIMSNRGFDDIHLRLLEALKEAQIADHGSPIWS